MRCHRQQRGFSLVTAIFLITVLATLGTCLITISSTSHQTPVLGLNGAQAYHAARSGLEWGIEGAIDGGGACNGTFALGQYDLAVACTSSVHNDDGTNITVYKVTATATAAAPATPGDIAYASRTLRATVSDSPPET